MRAVKRLSDRLAVSTETDQSQGSAESLHQCPSLSLWTGKLHKKYHKKAFVNKSIDA